MDMAHNLFTPFHLFHLIKDDEFTHLYSYIETRIDCDDRCIVIYATEENPDKTFSKMSAFGFDAKRYIADDKLIILDRKKLYTLLRQPNKSKLMEQIELHIQKFYKESKNILDRNSKNNDAFSNVSGKNNNYKDSNHKKDNDNPQKKKVILIIGSSWIFNQAPRKGTLMEIEMMLENKPTGKANLQIICCYDEKAFSTFYLRDIISIVNIHQFVLKRKGNHEELLRDEILSIVSNGIDKVLGRGASHLVFKTMRLVYKIDKDSTFAEPALFEEKLSRIIGNSYPAVLASIQSEMINSLL